MALASTAIINTSGMPGPNRGPLCVSVCRSSAGRVTCTTNRSITRPSSRHRADALQQVAQRDVRGRRSDAGDDRVRHDRNHVSKSIEMRV